MVKGVIGKINVHLMATFRQRCVITTILLLSYVLIGSIVAYCLISDDPYQYYIVQNRVKEYVESGKSKELESYLSLPIRGFVKPVINTRMTRNSSQTTIFVITPTYQRVTQKLELTSLCHTFSLVDNIIWILVEDSKYKTDLVLDLLLECAVRSVHLNVETPPEMKHKWWHWSSGLHHRGINQRNAGILWLRENYSLKNCNGVVYFADDDNRYGLKLFDAMRKTERVSIWPVGFILGLTYEGPICRNNSIIFWRQWKSYFSPYREFPIDMAGFAVHLSQFFKHPKALFDSSVGLGQLETEFILQFISHREEAECRGSEKEVFVWHIKTTPPDLQRESKALPKYKLQT